MFLALWSRFMARNLRWESVPLLNRLPAPAWLRAMCDAAARKAVGKVDK
ncbi:MAG TPA: hypothetical protein VMY42_18080 [Thermoguttaceae bacterium]|nr:hypothetical protein [Thermoguttaceae bacterium]